MAIVPYPFPNCHEGEPRLKPIVTAPQSRAELTGSRQVFDAGYSWWVATITTARMSREDARRWRLFFGRARGPVNSFRVPVVGDDQHGGSFAVRAMGAGDGYSLVTDGWPASTSVLPEGEYVTVGDQLMVLDAAVVTNASGEAELKFHSPLRGVVADNTIVTTKRPFLLASLPKDSPALGLGLDRLQLGFSFDAVEAY